MSDSKNDPDPGAVGSGGVDLSGPKKLLSEMAEMRAPHFLMPSNTLAHVIGAGFLLAVGSLVIAFLRSFEAATDSDIADNLKMVLVSYAILAFAGVVALRKTESKEAVVEDWVKFSSLTYMLLLAAAVSYAVLYGVSGFLLGDWPVNYFSDFDPNLIHFTYAAVSSLIVVACISWRTKKIHSKIWADLPNKRKWAGFYTILVALAVTWIAAH